MEQLITDCQNGNAQACIVLSQGDLFQIAMILAMVGAFIWFGASLVEKYYIPWRTRK